MNAAEVGSMLAPVNALLNATSGALIFAGWFAIRRKRVEMHRRRMQAAIVISAIFLVTYLLRVSLTGTHRFPDVGFVRTIYLFILSSHTLLAMVAFPLVIATFRLARAGNFETHRKLARITFPIWAYVSVTGIIVYLMLYQLAPRLASSAALP
jgi:putative membrane protein